MAERFKFQTLANSSGTVANVFIHGYSAGHVLRDRRLLARSVPTSLQGSVNICAFWNSGHWADADAGLSGLLKIGSGVSHAAFGSVGGATSHFLRARRRAEYMGAVLLSQLDDYLLTRHREVRSVNLIGHSLGGRVVLHAVKSIKRLSRLAVNDVLLLAAAAEVAGDEAARLARLVDGRLMNAYSTSDNVLRLNVGEVSLGRRNVEPFEGFEMNDFGHTAYWPKLNEVMAKVRFAGYVPSPDAQASCANRLDSVRNDIDVYDVLDGSPVGYTREAMKHLNTSRWASKKVNEAGLAYTFVDELQRVAGSCLANAARGRGICYAGILDMLADHYGLRDQCWECGNMVEMEALLVQAFFTHAFGPLHPLASTPWASASLASPETYFRQVDALAQRLTLVSGFKASRSTGMSMSPAATLGGTSTVRELAEKWVRKSVNEVSRVVTHAKTALRPGFSALIPAVAIVFYARLKLGDESLM